MPLAALCLVISCCLLCGRCTEAYIKSTGAAGTAQAGHFIRLKDEASAHRILQQQQQQQQQLIGDTNITAGTLGYWGASIGTDLVPDLGGQPVIAIASGWRLVVVLFKNHSVAAWGDAASQQLEIPIEATTGPVKAIAAGKSHALALLATGRVVQWGIDSAGTVPAEAQQNVTAIWAGDSNSFAQLNNGTIIGWGTIQSIGRILPKLQGVKYLAETAANGYVVLFNNGTLLNCTTAVGAAVPDTPLAVQDVRSVAVSMAAVKYGPPQYIIVFRDNTTVAWGGNGEDRALGASGLTDVAAAAAGTHSLVLFNNGTVKGFGINTYGEVSMPPTLLTSSSIIAIASGNTHNVALRADGSVFVWGRLNAFTDPILPPSVRPPAAIVSVSASWYHSLVLNADGGVTAFGVDFDGETAVPVIIHNNAIAVSAGRNHSLVLTQTGRVVSFGALKDSGVPPAALSGVVAIAAGGLFSVAVKNDSSLVIWGTSPSIYTCGLNAIPTANTAQIKQISAGNDHVLALLSDGSVRAWGCGPAAVVPSNIAFPAVAVSAANQHSVVLLQNGQVVYFGNDYGLIGLSSSVNLLSGITMIASGAEGVSVMTSDGQLAYYGNNTDNFVNLQLTPGTTATTFDMGAEFILAVVVPSSPPQLPQPPSQPLAVTALATKNALPMVAVIAIAAVVGVTSVAMVIGAAFWFKHGKSWRKYSKSEDQQQLFDGMVTCIVDRQEQEQEKPLVIPGLMFGEAFIHTTARAYTWAHANAGLDTSYAVEPGVNDTQLDQLLNTNDGHAEAHTSHCPVVQLTKQQVCEQIQLLPDRLLGKGATAYCFKCVWPSRFGNALLAAKVLKEGTNPEINSLQSFVYEASVLESAIHPNIVRMYGYCLEPPVVCLILELMPYSLKDLLYKHVQPPTSGNAINEATATANEPEECLLQPTASNSLHADSAFSTKQSQYITANSMLKSCDGVTPYVVSALRNTTLQSAATYVSQTSGHSVHQSETTVINSQGYANTSQSDGMMQLLDGGSAENNHLKSRLSMLQVLRYSSDIAAGLAYLHTTPVRQGVTDVTQAASGYTPDVQEQRSSRIIHRDLKPANVMISWRGVAKLSDFGLARQHDKTTVITSGVGAGTLPYMAPELLVASMAGMSYQNPTNRVDIYSLAMMVWEMLAGESPWHGMHEAGIITAVISGRRPELQGLPAQVSTAHDESCMHTKLLAPQHQVNVSLSQLPASLDALPEFNTIIKACWHHRELKRPTAAAVSEALNALLSKFVSQDLSMQFAQQSKKPS